jgi:hypothetical protein
MNLGEQWYLLRAQEDQLQQDLNRADSLVQNSAAQTGTQAGQRMGAGMASGVRGAGDQMVGAQTATAGRLGGVWGNLTGQLKQNWNGVALAAGAIGTTLAAGAITSFMADSVNAAAEWQDQVSATGVIFGEQAIPQMRAWAEEAHNAFGASQRQALQAANTMAVFGKSAGLTGDELTAFAQQTTQLGGDLASMFGGTTEDAILAVGSALRGESEPIRRYGVLLDDATLRQRAFEMGLISTTTNALTPQQRVLAAHAEIMAQTTDAQGDFARTSDGMANTQRNLGAQVDNLMVKFGEQLLPVFLDLANFTNDVLLPTFEFLATFLIGPLAQGISSVVQGVTQFIDTIIGIPGAIGDVLGAVGDFVTGNDDAASSLYKLEESAWTTYQGVSSAAVEGMVAARERTVAEARTIGTVVPDEIKSRWGEIRDAGYQQAVAYAAGLLDGQNEPRVALDVMHEVAATALTRQEEIMRLRGALQSRQLAEGLNDARPEVRAAAEAARAAIENRLRDLDAWQYGNNVGTTFASGLSAAEGVVRTAAGGVAAAAEGQLAIRSEPKDPTSPLRGITKWGGNLVREYADDMIDKISIAQHASGLVAAALAPNVSIRSAAGLAPSVLASGAYAETVQRSSMAGAAALGATTIEFHYRPLYPPSAVELERMRDTLTDVVTNGQNRRALGTRRQPWLD